MTPRSAVSSTRRAGRPALVSRDQIAQTATELGLSDLTMQAVADRLGVSVTSLYYHVRGREDLRSLAAQYTAARHQPPVPLDQHWAVWLAEWAEHTRAAFVEEPGLLEHYLKGTLGLGSMLSHLDTIIGFMERQGFEPGEAMAAYALVTSCAVGAAVSEVRQAQMIVEGRSMEVQFKAVKGSQRLKHLAKLRDAPQVSFQDQVCTVLVGIAVRRGDRPKKILALFEPLS